MASSVGQWKIQLLCDVITDQTVEDSPVRTLAVTFEQRYQVYDIRNFPNVDHTDISRYQVSNARRISDCSNSVTAGYIPFRVVVIFQTNSVQPDRRIYTVGRSPGSRRESRH
jgi:hypothetical protein